MSRLHPEKEDNRPPRSLSLHRPAVLRAHLRFTVAILVACSAALGGCKKPASDTAAQAPAESKIGESGLNVLLVSVDTTRADCIGCYGHPIVKTPNIDRFAAEGTRFAQCISAAPLTLPSHSTMLTGSYPFVHGARDNGIFELNQQNVTISEILKAAGYATHAEVAASVLEARYGLNQGFDTYGDMITNPPPQDAPRPSVSDAELDPDGGVIPTSAPPQPQRPQVERKAEHITQMGIKLLRESAGSGQPFFMFLHYFDPHWPHEAPPRFDDQYEDGYFAEIAYFDEQFGKLIDAIRDLGLAGKTLVILTSDHGEGRGQHGELTHSNFVYDTTLHVPLMMWCPGQVPPGQTVESQVRLVDLAPTILGFVKLTAQRSEQMAGVSLLPLLSDPSLDLHLPSYSDSFVAQHVHGYSQLRALRHDGWKYILAPRSELYHVAEDRLELFNLAETQPQRAGDMQESLWNLIAESPEPPGGRAARQDIDDEQLQKLHALGYLTGANPTGATDASDDSTELDHFEPVGPNPRDHTDQIESLAMGMGALRGGLYEIAEQYLSHFLENAPDNTEGLRSLGAAMMGQERYDEAFGLFQRVVELDPENHEAQRIMGLLLGMRGEFVAAEQACRRAIAIRPDDFRSHVEIARALTGQRRFDDALEEFKVAAELAPDDPTCKFQNGLTLKLAGRPEEALVSLKEAARLEPAFARSHVVMGNILRGLGRPDEAIEWLSKGLTISPEDPLLFHQLALCHIAKGELQQGEDYLGRIINLMPESAAAERNLGMHMAASGRHTEAIEHLLRATELRPNYVVALQELASAQELSGDSAGALRTYERLCAVAPQPSEAYRAAANLCDRTGKPEQAIVRLRKARTALPDDAHIANDLAWRLATSSRDELRDGQEAVKLAEQANAAQGAEDAGLLDTLAAAYAEAGCFDEAVATAGRAVELARQSGQNERAERIAAHRALYEQNTPLRDTP